MQKTKADLLNERCDELNRKAIALHRMTKSMLTLCKDFDHRIDAIKAILVGKKLCTEDELDAITDELRGLRQRGEAEPIVAGDIAWVNYEAKIDDKVVAAEQNLPVRIGSKSIVFEDALVGHFSGEKGIKFFKTLDQGPDKGKEVAFLLDVLKVKTLTDAAKEEVQDELDEPADEAGIEPVGQADGHGDQAGSDGSAGVVQLRSIDGGQAAERDHAEPGEVDGADAPKGGTDVQV